MLLPDVLRRLNARCVELGLLVVENEKGLRGTKEHILAIWFLGGRKVVYRVSCALDEPSHTVRFREAVVETSWGLAPPTFTVERTAIKGARLSGTRTDVVPGGGGSIDYAQVREGLEEVAREANWQFAIEVGRKP